MPHSGRGIEKLLSRCQVCAEASLHAYKAGRCGSYGEWTAKAAARLEDECKSGKFDKYGSAMKEAVQKALLDFCRQDDEFAQAVVQGGSFTDCMAAVGKKSKTAAYPISMRTPLLSALLSRSKDQL